MGKNDKKNKLTPKKIMDVLDWSYDKAINGLGNMPTVEELANEYLKSNKSVNECIDEFIMWQVLKCTTNGFLTGVGGLITLPVALPTNITSVLYIQTRMVATIAYMKGYNVRDDKVKTIVFTCLTGKSATDILKGTGIQIGVKMGKALIGKIPGEVIKQINVKVGFRLLTRFGEQGVIKLSKGVPIVGGVIGGSMDGSVTYTIGKIAKKVFR